MGTVAQLVGAGRYMFGLQVVKLSRIRDDVERELEDLTASLFQEAHKMVQEANMKRAQAEKSLAESDMKVRLLF